MDKRSLVKHEQSTLIFHRPLNLKKYLPMTKSSFNDEFKFQFDIHNSIQLDLFLKKSHYYLCSRSIF